MVKKAIIIGVSSYSEKLEKSLDELEQLAKANGIEVKMRMKQLLSIPNKYGYFGKGKLEELNNYLLNNDDVLFVIADDELSASVIRNIKKSIERSDVLVMDRTTLILDIFEKRASTKEAINQVAIAKYKYQLTHLVAAQENYDQQRGGAQVYNRGAGEKKINLDRHAINKKISLLNKEIEESKKTKSENNKRRNQNLFYNVALVGYTNAGKSTILNRLVNSDKKVFEKDMLFATLDTSIRKVYLKNNRSILLSDTVGFINKLPHNLVVSFNSTLSEAVDADLILHVVDFSDENYHKHIEVTNNTLDKIGVPKSTKRLMVFNKIDGLNKEIDNVKKDKIIYISAIDEGGIELLKDTVYEYLFKDVQVKKLFIPYQDGNVFDYLNRECNVINTSALENGYLIEVELTAKEINYFSKYIKK